MIERTKLSKFSLYRHDRLQEILKFNPRASTAEIDEQIRQELSKIPMLKEALKKLAKIVRTKLKPEQQIEYF